MENFNHLSYAISGILADEVVVLDTDFMKGLPRINIAVSTLYGTEQIGLSLKAALQLYYNLGNMFEVFKKAGYDV